MEGVMVGVSGGEKAGHTNGLFPPEMKIIFSFSSFFSLMLFSSRTRIITNFVQWS